MNELLMNRLCVCYKWLMADGWWLVEHNNGCCGDIGGHGLGSMSIVYASLWKPDRRTLYHLYACFYLSSRLLFVHCKIFRDFFNRCVFTSSFYRLSQKAWIKNYLIFIVKCFQLRNYSRGYLIRHWKQPIKLYYIYNSSMRSWEMLISLNIRPLKHWWLLIGLFHYCHLFNFVVFML